MNFYDIITHTVTHNHGIAQHMRKLISYIRAQLEEHRSLILVLALASLLLILPIIIELGGTMAVVHVAFLVVMLAMTFRTAHYRHHVIANVAFLLSYFGTWFITVPTILPHLLIIGAIITTIMVLFKSIFVTERVTIHVINSAISIYLLMGVAWSMVYTILLTLNPHAYNLPMTLTENAKPIYMMYYSFGTMTTLGYGDILPLSLTAQIWAVAETVMGVLYLTILMARLVSLYEFGMIDKK